MLSKIDILLRKLAIQYDESFAIENIVPTEDEFNEMADMVRRSCYQQYSDAEFYAARQQVRETREASLGIVLSIDKQNDSHDLEWFNKFCESNPQACNYNYRFERYMATEKHWSDSMIRELNRNTNEIMNRLGDPRKVDSWKRKGLVIGDVQSGKTVNYTSVCNKAIDAGYKVIIILAGRTNTLRRQTQKRIESDCIGLRKDDANQKKGEVLPTIPVGVGLFSGVSTNIAEAVTTNVTDFSKKLADSRAKSINEHMAPQVFVVKKVKSVLDNLAGWFGQGTINVPMLLIDDEADDASINTKTVDSPTTINACIRKILKKFSRSTYLAVTATPFANILIDPYVNGTDKIDTDLFPEDFICCLPTPSKYIGSEKMFRDEDNEGLICSINSDDVEDAFPFKHKKTQEVACLPSTLKDALRYFAITNAVRDILGHANTHRSMMVNVSRFVDVQNQVKSQICDFWQNEIMLFIKSYACMGETALNYKEIVEIKAIFERYHVGTTNCISWEEVQAHLYTANEKVAIVAVNQKSTDTLDYERYEKENKTGLRVIAIGGDCLSRGLTLEGLCVSYFYRNSQMYDTLMQMGRWFGFRPGYDKLVRVWMAEDAVSWYSHISEATEALKLEVYRMNRSKLTPMEFGYKIMGHPDALIPTARGKMKNARMDVTYAEVDVSGHLIESPRLYNSERILLENAELAREFIKKVTGYCEIVDSNAHMKDLKLRGVKAMDVATLVEAFKSKLWHFYFESSTLADSIRNSDEEWQVIVKNGQSEPMWGIELANGTNMLVGAQVRASSWSSDEIKISGSKVRIGSGGATISGIEGDVSIESVRKKWESLPDEICKKKDGSGYKSIPDDFILHGFVKKPILFIHNIKITPEHNNEKDLLQFSDEDVRVVALGLAFPSEEDYVDSKINQAKQRKVKVYLNVIAQDLESEEGDDFVDENL